MLRLKVSVVEAARATQLQVYRLAAGSCTASAVAAPAHRTRFSKLVASAPSSICLVQPPLRTAEELPILALLPSFHWGSSAVASALAAGATRDTHRRQLEASAFRGLGAQPSAAKAGPPGLTVGSARKSSC